MVLWIQKYINGYQIDQLHKKFIKIFKEIGFKLDLETNLKIVGFLDMTFNLVNGSYKLYKKPNSILLFINKILNDSPKMIKKLPKTINDRLCIIYLNADIFHATK